MSSFLPPILTPQSNDTSPQSSFISISFRFQSHFFSTYTFPASFNIARLKSHLFREQFPLLHTFHRTLYRQFKFSSLSQLLFSFFHCPNFHSGPFVIFFHPFTRQHAPTHAHTRPPHSTRPGNITLLFPFPFVSFSKLFIASPVFLHSVSRPRTPTRALFTARDQKNVSTLLSLPQLSLSPLRSVSRPRTPTRPFHSPPSRPFTFPSLLHAPSPSLHTPSTHRARHTRARGTNTHTWGLGWH